MNKTKPINFNDIITPYSVQEFISKFWSKEFTIFHGDKDRFKALLPWDILNKILEEHRLEDPRLRLAQNGKTIPASEYTSYSMSRRGTSVPRLIPKAFTEKLKSGATLVIDAIEELYEPIRSLSLSFESIFNETAQVNAYIGWGNTTGFDVHWDDHEVFILQVFGKKQWYIYGQTREHPLYKDIHVDNTEAPKVPLWEGILNPGETLYIPRGCWHNAIPCNEPSVHLTFGITNRTGLDFHNWLNEILVRDSFFRKDIPFMADQEAIKKYFEEFKVKLSETLEDYSLIHKYRNFYNGNARVRPFFSLPFSVNKSFPLTENMIFRLSIGRTTNIDEDNENMVLSFTANGKSWKFSILTFKFFKELFKHKALSYSDALKSLNQVPKDQADLFFKELFETGIIYIDHESDLL